MPSPVIRIFTYKAGLLSRFGHDLQFTLRRVELQLEDGKLEGRFWTDSLQLDGVVKDGSVDARALSDSDREKIVATAKQEVLQAGRCPSADFEASVEADKDGFRVRGTLTLLGQRRALPSAHARVMGKHVVAAMSIEPSRWGIRPYKAMAGALRLQDRIGIEISLEAEPCADKKQAWRSGE